MSSLLERLGRTTSSGRFIPQIDGLRFVAIGSVIAFHTGCVLLDDRFPAGLRSHLDTDMLWQLTRVGYVGVPLFFAISGFILALPFASHHICGTHAVPLRKYLARRVTRLEPTYIINLLLCAGLLVVASDAVWSGIWKHLLSCLTYSHWLFFAGEHPEGMINGVGWSLEIEVQFYLLAPLLTQVYRVRRTVLRRSTIALAMALLAVLRSSLVAVEDKHGWTLATEAVYFLVGFLLVDLYLVDWPKAPQRGYMWDAVSTVAWLGIIPAVMYTKLNAFVVPPLILAAYVGAFRGRVLSRVFSNAWLTTIGGMCYTIYLYHYLVISATSRVTCRWVVSERVWPNLLLQTLVMFAVIVAASSVLFAVFEKPFMQKDWPTAWYATVARAFRSVTRRVRELPTTTPTRLP